MTYRTSYEECRKQYLSIYSREEVQKYDEWVVTLTDRDHTAWIKDVAAHVSFQEGMNVLDAGAGTGALCLTLQHVTGVNLTALEPCPPMLDSLRAKPELAKVATQQGFCDHPSDVHHFPPNTFDVIASRQLVNNLYDPVAALRNWHTWLRPGGTVIITDGMFERADWQGEHAELPASLPLACCSSPITVAYLVEQAGFAVRCAEMMKSTNELASTRTKRFMIVADAVETSKTYQIRAEQRADQYDQPKGSSLRQQPIVVEHEFRVSPRVLWQAITSPNQMRQWYFQPMEDFEPTVGFETEFDVESEGTVYRHQWKVIEAITEERLAYEWRYAGYQGESIATWELSETDRGTLVRLTHSGGETFPQDNPIFSRESGVAGWTYLIEESLADYLERGSADAN